MWNELRVAGMEFRFDALQRPHKLKIEYHFESERL